MRKTILACTVSLLMSPVASWALGMGDIQVNSSLNQPLKAEISLQSVTKKDLDSLLVGLASKKMYSRANIERSDYLSDFKFNIIQKNGKNYVSVTTHKPFREPFASFLVEASWGSGRLLREYTMLLDPPEFIKKHARPVATAKTSRSSQVKRTKQSSTKKASSSSSNVVLSPSSSQSSGDLSYGPVKRNDILWNIAKGMAPAGVSVDQMMMALLRDNPEAFVNDNINNLKEGYVLRIKDSDSLKEVSRSNAHRQVQEQYQSWKEARKQKSTANIVDRSDRQTDSTPKDGQLKLVAAGDVDNVDMQGDLGTKAKNLKDKLVLASETIDSKESENEELRARIMELEELLQTKSSLVELKDESLAAMQRQTEMQVEGIEETASEIPAETDALEAEASDIKTEMTDVIGDGVSPDHIDPSVELSKDEMAASESTSPVNVDEIIALPEVVPEVAPVEQVKAPEAVVKPKPKPAPPPPVHEEVIDVLLSEEMLPFTAGSGALLVLLFTWLGLRGRGKKENTFEESILDSKHENSYESDFSVDDSSKDVLASESETSFLSDFSADDMESLQPDDTEADPISEADVFMVYGRYQQAEELLKTTVKSAPERVDYQLKLLEVYHGDNMKDSFAVQADVVKGLLQKNNDDYELSTEWIKAKSWADKLDVNIDMPDSFDESTTEVNNADATDIENTESDSLDDEAASEFSLVDDLDTDEFNLNEDTSDFSLDEDSLNLDGATELEDDSLELEDDSFELEDDSLELEDDSLELGDLQDQDESTAESDSEETFELDESILDADDSIFDADDSILDADDSILDADDSILDVDDSILDADDSILDADDSILDADDSILDVDDSILNVDDSILDADDSILDADDSILDVDDSILDADDSILDADDSILDVDDSILDVDDSILDVDDSIAPESDDELELENDLPEVDPVGTKLDLAKAYIDMEDMESASSILNEVIDEGDDVQKSQAKSLLEQTDS